MKRGLAIAALATVFLALGATAIPLARWLLADRESVVVHEIRVDRTKRAFIDIVFSRPIAPDQPGEVVTDAPATIDPELHGVWRWMTANILRFEPAGALPIASEYRLVLDKERIGKPELPFSGKHEFLVKTDEFLVRRITWSELPSGNGLVVLQGEAAFNYRVAPESLAPRIRLRDGQSDVKVELLTSYPTDSLTWRSVAIRKEKRERDVALIIDRSLFPIEGNVTLPAEHKQVIHVGSSERLEVRSMTATPSEHDTVIRIELSSPVNAEAARGKLSVTPIVKFQVATEGNSLLLAGKFQPGKTYDIKIEDGLTATDAAMLRSAYSQSIAIADLEPLLTFRSEGMFLSASGRKNIAIDAINVRSGRLVIDRVYRNNLFYYLQDSGYSTDSTDEWGDPYYRAYLDPGPVAHRYGDRIAEKKLELPGTPNVRTSSTIALGSLVRKSSPGLYKVSVYREDEDWRASTRWILLTDLGVVAKRSPGAVMVWVASFKDLSSIANASVSLINDQNQTIARGRTDERGFWTARGIAPDAHPFLITVERDGDFSFLLLGNSRVDLSAFDVGGIAAASSGYFGFLYGERTLYRPGETLRGVAAVRTRELEHAPAMPLVLQHVDPTGEPRGSIRLTAKSGIASYELPLPSYSRTGRHTLNLLAGDAVIGSTSFHVEEFVPDRIKVEIATPPNAAAGSLSYTVSSSYLFGAPAAALEVQTRVRLVPSIFSAKGFEDYTFHAESRKFDPRELAALDGTLDELGVREFRTAIPEGLVVPSSLQAVVTARVQEKGGRGVSAITRVPVHVWPYYVGLRELSRPNAADSRRFEWTTVSPAGKAIASGPLRAEIFEERWHTVMRQTSNGGYAYESARDSELVKTISIPAGKSRGEIRFTPRGWGSYRLVVTDPASLASSEQTFDAWDGSGYSPWAMKNPGRLELTLDHSSYRSNEAALVTIKSPFRGKALLTVESDRVLYSAVTSLETNNTRIEVPLMAAARPNAYITATVVRTANDLEPGEAGRAFGAVRVDVDRAENEIPPVITVAEEMRSSRTLKVAVKTIPHAQVTIAAVDQGILQLAGETKPDPFGYFYQRRALDVMTHDTFAQLLPEVAARNKPVAGGSESGANVSQFLRTDSMHRAKPVSFWSGVISTGQDGVARASFAIPEFQGAVRVTAVVLAEEKFGSSDALVRVRDPIVVLPTVPRFVSAGDVFTVPVTIRNDTKKDGPFEISVQATGEGALTAQPAQTHTIKAQQERTVHFNVRAAELRGTIRVAFEVSGNGERATTNAMIPVLPPLPDATDEQSGSIAQATMVLPSAPATKFQAGTAPREVIFSPLPVMQLRGRLDYLIHYPYGCVEQTTSTAFPMIYLADIMRELETKGQRSAASYVGEGIRRLSTMQTVTGGFSMWPYGEEVNVWGSIYATHFLVEARRAGHAVDTLRYNRALDYVAQLAKAQPQYDANGIQQVVYALYVLGRAKRPDLGMMDHIREKHFAWLTFESRALLGAAYAATGNQAAVEAMLADIEREETVIRQTGGNYNSTLRNRALVVLAMLDAAPADPRLPRLAERLVRETIRERAYTTQESALGLIALGQYFRARRATATYKGTLLLDGTVVGRFDAKTTRFEGLSPTGELKVIFDEGYPPYSAYFAVRQRGTPALSSFSATESGLRLTRTFFDRDGRLLEPRALRQGELVVLRTEVTSTNGPLQNVVVQNLLPGGLEVENPRLTTETLPWVQSLAVPQHADIRDDRVLFFVDLEASRPVAFYTVARAITAGEFTLPPAQAEAMYMPAVRATQGLGKIKVAGR